MNKEHHPFASIAMESGNVLNIYSGIKSSLKEGIKVMLAFLLLYFYVALNTIYAQTASGDTLVLTLDEVIQTAKEQSPAALQARTYLKNSYWQYRTYQANNLPGLTLGATLPNYNHTISPITQPDGSVLFVPQDIATSQLNLSLNQNIEWTGGTVSVGSMLNRIDLFGTDASKSYSSNPVFIGLTQPLFQYNSLKWDHRIQPILYDESKRRYIEDMEAVSETASNLFFDLLLAQVNKEIAENNLENTDTLYQISVGRYNLGKIAENELLQIQMRVMNAKSDLAQSRLDMQLSMIALRNYLDIKGEQGIRLILPEKIPSFTVDYSKALTEARSNRQDMLTYERQKLEAKRDVAQAVGNTGFKANIYTSYGLSQSAPTVATTYLNPLASEQFNLGITVPILDWSKGHSQVETAKANQQITDLNLQVAEQNFEQEIVLVVNRIQLLTEKARIAQQNDTISEKRNDITMQRYLIGKIGILDLNVARDERVQARRDYISSLRNFWYAYYDLRKKTLFDFVNYTKLKD